MPAFKKGEVWKAIDTIMPNVQRLLLYGPPGTGKTHAATLSGLQKDEQVFQITLTPDTPAAALLGHFIIKGRGGCVWLDGVGIEAWRAAHTKPARLVINEIDHAGPDAVSALHLLLDDLNTAGLTLPTGEYVQPGKGLKIVATMNGDPMDLLPSLQDRLTIRILINEVHPNAIAGLPKELQTPAAKGITVADNKIKVSIRAWQSFAALSAQTDEETAAKCIFGDQWGDILNGIKVGK